ncbi:uncharacterized protein DFL_005284 [Arthrobotrys flagrans]|uniref:Uncharacterized protein n=1 Tax=Arthrobotrys flagrans TaxID=97331 RepID=A0A437A772_ARTFL|nr:hypothetical protein DFL_005284 [Arthrobotrys flagrans]
MLQKLSRESLRLNPPPQNTNGPIIYETSKQVKKAYNKRKGTLISEAEKKRIERIRVLDERAEKIKQKEQRKKENILKRKAKEEKEGPKFKKIARITSSQPELSKFFVSKKGQSAPVKRGLDYSVNVAQGHLGSEVEDVQAADVAQEDLESEAGDVQAVDPELSADEEASEHFAEADIREQEAVIGAEIQSGIPAEIPIDDSNIPAASPTLVGEQGNEYFTMGQKATMKLCSQLSLPRPSNTSERLVGRRLAAGGLLDGKRLLSTPIDELSPLPHGIPDSSPPLPIHARVLPSEPAEEEAETRLEEDERILEILREQTDYNDFDDDYDLEDSPGFDYEYAEGPTSPVHEVEDETYGDKGLDIAASDEAYGMGLSDPAFDELHDGFFEHEAEEAHAEESEQGFDSSFLCQAFEDDLRELEEEGF